MLCLEMPFFEFIRLNFGFRACFLLKLCIKLMNRNIKNRIRIHFLKRCFREQLVPVHLMKLLNYRIDITDRNASNKINKLKQNFVHKVLRVELNDSYRQLSRLQYDLFRNYRNITLVLPHDICDLFFRHQEVKFARKWQQENVSIVEKIERLRRVTNYRKFKYVNNINYTLTMTEPQNKCTGFRPSIISKISINEGSTNDSNMVHHISVRPDKFSFSFDYKFDNVNRDWLVNLTDIDIPDNVKYILQLGQRFNLPNTVTNKGKMTCEFIKHIESNILKLDEQTKNLIRKDTIPILNNINYSSPNNNLDKIIKQGIRELRMFLNDNPGLLVTRADKGNTTVILTYRDYIEKMQDILSDKNTYRLINRDPTNKMTTTIRSLLMSWRSKGFIEQEIYKKLYISDGELPRSYGLPKIHKTNTPLRIIISCINSPFYKLAVFLKDIINKSLNIKEKFGHIKNSYELVKRINGLLLPEGYKIVSLDISSMYSNIPMELVVNSVLSRWSEMEKNTSIPIQEFKRAISIILESAYFRFNDEYYEQIFGLTMGSPLSPIVADLVIQDLEISIFSNLRVHMSFYYRYVDDIVLAAPKDEINNILDSFNAYHERIKFTIDHGDELGVTFLDVKLLYDGGGIMFDLYKKPTHSGRFLSFFSNHPMTHKKGVVIGLVDKVLFLSHPKFHHANMESLINSLLRNGYPLQLVFKIIKNRIKSLSNKDNFETISYCDQNCDLNIIERKHFPIPYIKGASEKFNLVLNKYKFQPAYKPMNNLHKYIKTGKDKAKKEELSNVVQN